MALAADVTGRPLRQAHRVNRMRRCTVFHAGDQIENPVTGERLVFHETAAETGGERVVFETIVQPGGFVAAAHIHPFQTERFEVLAGTIEVKKGRKRHTATAGEVLEVEPGVAHSWRNASDYEELRFLVEVRPALQFERLIETMFGLAADGKTNKKGMPNPLRMAVIANAYLDDVGMPHVPGAIQKAALATGAAVGRLVGYQPQYAPGTADAKPATASA